MSKFIQISFAVIFGPLLSLASVGLYHFITFAKKSVLASIAFVSIIIAGVLISTMLLVQMAIRYSKPEQLNQSEKWIWKSFNHIHYGLDVSWDAYIFIGTLFFAMSMHKHPHFGPFYSISGVLISLTMIIFNILSFPNPPATSHLIDLGPFISLWYLMVTITILIKYKKVLSALNQG